MRMQAKRRMRRVNRGVVRVRVAARRVKPVVARVRVNACAWHKQNEPEPHGNQLKVYVHSPASWQNKFGTQPTNRGGVMLAAAAAPRQVAVCLLKRYTVRLACGRDMIHVEN